MLILSTQGNILLNGENIKNISKNSYYTLFAPVFQDYNIYAYTIKDNIGFGREDKQPFLSRLIESFFNKEEQNKIVPIMESFMTKEYSESGVDLSGGEYQKIAVMRALYKDSAIIVLDEPSSSFSPKSEEKLYKYVRENTKDKTVLFISHRLASCKFCDEILVINDGVLVEQGNHYDLMTMKGIYYNMFNIQKNIYNKENKMNEEKLNK